MDFQTLRAICKRLASNFSLVSMHERIQEDLDGSPNKHSLLVYLGDYVDRGPDSREVLELLRRDIAPTSERLCLMGNHEQILLRFLEDPRIGRSWMDLGGDATLASYGISPTPSVPPDQRMQTLSQNLKEAMPESHKGFLRDCAVSHREGDYLFVHAGIRPGRPLERQTDQDLLWIRALFLESRRDHGFRVVHGHNVVEHPEVLPNRIAVDTGACWSGRLTCVVLEEDQLRFLEAS